MIVRCETRRGRGGTRNESERRGKSKLQRIGKGRYGRTRRSAHKHPMAMVHGVDCQPYGSQSAGTHCGFVQHGYRMSCKRTVPTKATMHGFANAL